MDNLKFTNIGIILFMVFGVIGIFIKFNEITIIAFLGLCISILHLWAMKYLKFTNN